MSERRRIVLGEEDFDDVPAATPAPPSGAPVAARATGVLPPVARRTPVALDPVGLPAAAGAQPLNRPHVAALVSAVVGMALAWAVTELSGIAGIDARTANGAHAVTGLWTGIIGVVFTGVLVSFDHAVAGAWKAAGRRAARAAVPAFAVGFVAGFIANAVYVDIVERVLRDAFGSGNFDFSEHDLRFYLARSLGWAIFGTGAGVAIGLVARSRAKAVNGAIGGCIGGAAGGIAFQLTAALFESDRASRALGLVAVGGLIAIATRAVETARREAWLHVVAGGMAGKEFILYHPVTRIGAAPECEIFLLKDRSVAPLHAQIEERDSRRVLVAHGGAPVAVNRSPVASHVLRHGDVIGIGATALAYVERDPAPATHHHQTSTEDQWT